MANVMAYTPIANLGLFHTGMACFSVEKLSVKTAKQGLVVCVGQCDLDLGSSHYIRADTGLPRLVQCKHPDQPDMLDAINYATK